MTRRPWPVTAAAALIAAAAAAPVAADLLDGGWLRSKVLERLSEALGRDISVDGEIDVDVSWTPSLRAERVRLANAPWSDRPTMAEIDVLEASIDLRQLLSGTVRLPTLRLLRPRLLLEVSSQGVGNWRFDQLAADAADAAEQVAAATLEAALEDARRRAADGAPAAAAPVPPRGLPVLERFEIDGGGVRYVDHSNGAELALALERVSGRLTESGTRLEVRARAGRGEPFALTLDGGPPAALDGAGAALTLTLSAPALDLSIDGRVATADDYRGTRLRFSLSGDGVPDWFDQALPALAGLRPPRYRLQGALRRDRRWTLQVERAEIGASRVDAATLDVDPDARAAALTLTAPSIDLAQLAALAPAGAGRSADAGPPATLDLSPLRRWRGRADIGVDALVLDGVSVEQIALSARLERGRAALSLDAARVAGARFGAAAELRVGDALSGALRLDLPALPLGAFAAGFERGDTVAADLDVRLRPTPLGDDGRVSAAALAANAVLEGRVDVALPTYALAADGVFSASPDDGRRRQRLSADGRFRGVPFALRFSGGALPALLDARPYPLRARVELGGARLTLDGTVAAPLRLRGFDLDVTLSGNDPSRLGRRIGMTLPELPPYRLRARVGRDRGWFVLRDIDGRIGDSDVGGAVRFRPRDGAPPEVDATLRSARLDGDDLAGLLGSTPDAGVGETAASAQRREAARRARRTRLLTDEPLRLDALTGAFNGTIRYAAKRIEAPRLPLDDVELTLRADGGTLRIAPLRLGLGGGSVTARARVDTRRAPNAVTLTADVRRVDLRRVLKPFEFADDSAGTVGGQVKLWAYGDTQARLAASADGGLYMLMTGGRLDALLVELAGLDVAETAAALFGGAAPSPIDCAYLDVHVADGIAELVTALIDTRDTLFVADGFFDLDQELVGLIVDPRPKDFSPFSLRAPLYIEGRLGGPSVYPGTNGLARGAAALLLGAAATPVAALLPLLDLGDGSDSVYCAGFVERLDAAR